MKAWLRVAEAAKLVDKDRSVIYDHVWRGQLETKKEHGLTLIDKDSLLAFYGSEMRSSSWGSVAYSEALGNPDLFDTDEVAEMLGISASTVRKYFEPSEWHHCYLAKGDVARAYFYDRDSIFGGIASQLQYGPQKRNSFLQKIPHNFVLEAMKMLHCRIPHTVETECRLQETEKKFAQISAIPRHFLVESLSSRRLHKVDVIDGEACCECIGFQQRGKCKHTDCVYRKLYQDTSVEKGVFRWTDSGYSFYAESPYFKGRGAI